jgi:aspartate aminotransferase
MQAIESGFTSYTLNKGIEELREAISAKFARDHHFSVSPEEIIVTSGASEALHIAILSVVERGDEVLMPNPGFVSFAALTRLAEGKPVGVPLSEDFTMSVEAVKERITNKTKAFIINSPANPTGAVESEENIKALVDLATDHQLTIISDEVYEQLIYDGVKHVSPARFYDRVITVNAVSKTYAMTGFRLGYLAAPAEYVEQMLKIHQYIQACASSISQKAALAALTGPQDCVAEMRSEFKRRRDFAVTALREMGMEVRTPQGAFYIFPHVKDEQEFVETLRKRRIIVTPGSAFGSLGKNHVRISYALRFEKLKHAFEIMKDVVKKGK